MREFGLLYEAHPSPPFPRLEASLYNDAPLTDFEEVFTLPSTLFPFVTPSFSVIPIDTSVSTPTLLASPLPLA